MNSVFALVISLMMLGVCLMAEWLCFHVVVASISRPGCRHEGILIRLMALGAIPVEAFAGGVAGWFIGYLMWDDPSNSVLISVVVGVTMVFWALANYGNYVGQILQRVTERLSAIAINQDFCRYYLDILRYESNDSRAGRRRWMKALADKNVPEGYGRRILND